MLRINNTESNVLQGFVYCIIFKREKSDFSRLHIFSSDAIANLQLCFSREHELHLLHYMIHLNYQYV